MARLVVSGAKLQCSMGTSTPSLKVLPDRHTDGDNNALATVDDYQPLANIPAFGMCQSTSNPQVAAATAAAQGTLTPQPCVPSTTAPWSPGNPNVTVNERPALTADSTCNCTWAGTISITDPANTRVTDD